MPPALGFLLALLVLVVAIVLAAIGTLPVLVGGLFGALALAVMSDNWVGWGRHP